MSKFRGWVVEVIEERDEFDTQEEAREWATAYKIKLQKENPTKEYYHETDDLGVEDEDI